MLTTHRCLFAGFLITFLKMDISVYTKANTSRNNTYDVSVNSTDERVSIHFTKEFISEMTFDTEKKMGRMVQALQLIDGIWGAKGRRKN